MAQHRGRPDPEQSDAQRRNEPCSQAPDRSPTRDPRTGRAVAAERMARQHEYVDQQIRLAMQRGEFDDLPGAGKPLDLGAPQDRDWWLRKLIERERITGVLPAALQLRKDDAELQGQLDQQREERLVREQVEEFNRRVVEARRQLTGGPPVITPTRDVEAEVVAWHERRLARRRAVAQQTGQQAGQQAGRQAGQQTGQQGADAEDPGRRWGRRWGRRRWRR
ncbi:MAG TPA: DUF1992 domain-containing protein [Marmoricola sp.]|nr:DUF1992 domain-containing protein [Marmoricola sp.]